MNESFGRERRPSSEWRDMRPEDTGTVEKMQEAFFKEIQLSPFMRKKLGGAEGLLLIRNEQPRGYALYRAGNVLNIGHCLEISQLYVEPAARTPAAVKGFLHTLSEKAREVQASFVAWNPESEMMMQITQHTGANLDPHSGLHFVPADTLSFANRRRIAANNSPEFKNR